MKRWCAGRALGTAQLVFPRIGGASANECSGGTRRGWSAGRGADGTGDDDSDGSRSAPFAATRQSTDPNVFRGPGGYTAAQLFRKLQEAERKGEVDDEGKDEGEGPLGGVAAEGTGPASEQDGECYPGRAWAAKVRELRSQELQALLRTRGVDHSDCKDKESLVERALGLAPGEDC